MIAARQSFRFQNNVKRIVRTLCHSLDARTNLGQSSALPQLEMNDDIIPIRKLHATTPKALAEVIDCALAIDRKKRPQSAAELLTALRAVSGS